VYIVEGEKKEDFFAMKVITLCKAGSIDYTWNIKTMNSELQIGIELSLQCEYLVKTENFFIEKASCLLIMEYCSYYLLFLFIINIYFNYFYFNS
jgi:hypothetical protein